MTAMQLSVAGEESLYHARYLTVLNFQMMSTPGCTFCEIRFLLLTRSFQLKMSEWSLEPTATLSASDGSISSQNEI